MKRRIVCIVGPCTPANVARIEAKLEEAGIQKGAYRLYGIGDASKILDEERGTEILVLTGAFSGCIKNASAFVEGVKQKFPGSKAVFYAPQVAAKPTASMIGFDQTLGMRDEAGFKTLLDSWLPVPCAV